jgi:hypothetical protein
VLVEQQFRGEAQRLASGRDQLDLGREPMQRSAIALERALVAAERAPDLLAQLREREGPHFTDRVQAGERPCW